MTKRNLQYYLDLNYRAELWFDKEVNRWFARYPELSGCEADGATREEALAHTDDLKTVWFEMALERNATIPEPESEPTYSGKFVVRISKTLHERVARIAERDGVSLNQWVVTAIAAWAGADNFVEKMMHNLQRPLMQFVQANFHLASLIKASTPALVKEDGFGWIPMNVNTTFSPLLQMPFGDESRHAEVVHVRK